MTPAQCRAARAFIAMSQSDLARAAVVPVASVTDFETGLLALRPADLEAIRGALERAGVELTNGERPGVRLRK
jgi:DNA-binding transcriptional regulator YiaG